MVFAYGQNAVENARVQVGNAVVCEPERKLEDQQMRGGRAESREGKEWFSVRAEPTRTIPLDVKREEIILIECGGGGGSGICRE